MHRYEIIYRVHIRALLFFFREFSPLLVKFMASVYLTRWTGSCHFLLDTILSLSNVEFISLYSCSLRPIHTSREIISDMTFTQKYLIKTYQ